MLTWFFQALDISLSYEGVFVDAIAFGGLVAVLLLRWIRNEFRAVKDEIRGLSGQLNGHLARYEVFDSQVRTHVGMVSRELGLYNVFEGEIWQSSSPINLTQKGVVMADEMLASETAREFLPMLCDRVPESATDYEIQMQCFEYARREFLQDVDVEIRRRVHSRAFDEGKHVDDVLMIYGILFRNAVMEERGMTPPGLPDVEIAVKKAEVSRGARSPRARQAGNECPAVQEREECWKSRTGSEGQDVSQVETCSEAKRRQSAVAW